MPSYFRRIIGGCDGNSATFPLTWTCHALEIVVKTSAKIFFATARRAHNIDKSAPLLQPLNSTRSLAARLYVNKLEPFSFSRHVQVAVQWTSHIMMDFSNGISCLK